MKEFQRGNDLPATGNLDARTIKKLNPTKDSRIDTVIANMERWRWFRREIHPSRVEVNAPDFTLKVIHDGKQVWTTRIVIGKPSMPTPHPGATNGFHHRQSDLEGAGVDRQERISAGGGAGTRARWRAWEFAPSASTARS